MNARFWTVNVGWVKLTMKPHTNIRLKRRCGDVTYYYDGIIVAREGPNGINYCLLERLREIEPCNKAARESGVMIPGWRPLNISST